MKSTADRFNELNGKVITRSKIKSIINDARNEGNSDVEMRLRRILKKFPEIKSFELEIDQPAVDSIPPWMLNGIPFVEENDQEGLGKPVSPDDIYKMITDRVIQAMDETNGLPYQQGWKNLGGANAPRNWVSKKLYRGINAIMLGTIYAVKLDNPYFLTFKQIEESKGKLQKGSKGMPVVYFTKLYRYQEDDAKLDFGTYDRNKFYRWLVDNRGKSKVLQSIEIKDLGYHIDYFWTIPILKYYNVFHASNIDGIDWKLDTLEPQAQGRQFTEIEAGEKIVEFMPKRPTIYHKGNRAFYSPGADTVTMPLKEAFITDQEYYGTIFHELIHATGHKSRTGRGFGKGRFGSKDYAFEELIAELGACFLNGESGILYFNLKNSAAYLRSWKSALKKEMERDPKFFFRAASRAQEAADFILDRDQDGTPRYLKALLKSKANTSRPAPAKPKAKKEKAAALTGANGCAAVSMKIGSIFTDTARFQNRKTAFSEASAEAVAKHFEPNKFDPIVVWLDPKAKKTFVLSGHSRLEGMKRRKAKTVPVRYFDGTEKEAIKFSKVEANRSANTESFIEDLEAYRLMRDGDKSKGIEAVTKAELKRIFKGRSGKLDLYTYLNPTGLFVQALSSTNLSEFPHLEIRASWVGDLAKQWPEKFSKLMERNLFHFFYGEPKNLKLSREEFFHMAEQRLATLGADEHVLFPECTSDGCSKLSNELNDKLTGETRQRLKDVEDQMRFIKSRLKSNDPKIRVWTESEKKEIESVVIPKLQNQAEKLRAGIKELKESQSSLFGLAGPVEDALASINNAIDTGKKVMELPSKILDLVQPITAIDQNVPRESFKISGPLASFLGTVEKKPKGSVVMTMDAPQGSGKTRMLFQLANALGMAGNKGLFVSLEEDPSSKLFADKRDQYLTEQAQQNIAVVGYLPEGMKTLNELTSHFDFVLIDSWGKLGNPDLDEYRRGHDGKFIVVIYQRTQDGKMRGGSAAQFDGDMICKIQKGESWLGNYAYWDKNRYADDLNMKYVISSGVTQSLVEPEKE